MKLLTTTLAVFQICLFPLFCLAQDDVGVPKEFKSNIGQLVGQWATQGNYNGEEFEGTYSAEWNRDQTCLLLTSSYLDMKLNGMGGWDPANDEYVETWYRSDGFRFEQRFKLNSRQDWSGTVIMSTAGGEQESGTIDLNFRSDGSMDFKGQGRTAILKQTSTRLANKTSNRAEFDQFVNAFRGRWVGEIKWVADWKGVGGKKGDKATAYVEIRTSSDGNLLQACRYAGDSSGDWIVFYDAGDKMIRGIWVDSGGLIERDVFWKDGNNWKFELIGGSQADGSKLGGTGTVLVTEGGKLHTWTGTITIDGKKTDPLKDTYRRITDD